MCVCRSELQSSGPDRPLSQLLPDLQLNQHGFSLESGIFPAQPRLAMARRRHLITLDAIKVLCN